MARIPIRLNLSKLSNPVTSIVFDRSRVCPVFFRVVPNIVMTAICSASNFPALKLTVIIPFPSLLHVWRDKIGTKRERATVFFALVIIVNPLRWLRVIGVCGKVEFEDLERFQNGDLLSTSCLFSLRLIICLGLLERICYPSGQNQP